MSPEWDLHLATGPHAMWPTLVIPFRARHVPRHALTLTASHLTALHDPLHIFLHMLCNCLKFSSSCHAKTTNGCQADPNSHITKL